MLLRICLSALCLAAVTACGGGNDNVPLAPTPPPAPACQTNNTAELSFRNVSSRTTMDWALDGVNRGVTGPGQSLGPFTVAAGVQHQLVARLTNSTRILCTAQPVLASCSTQTLTCTD